MSVRDLLFLYRARLRAWPVRVQELLAVIGIGVGVALLFASQVASTSLGRSISQLTSEIAGNGYTFQLQARGPNGLPEAVASQVGRLPGVRQTLPVVEAQVSVAGRHRSASALLIGTNPRFAHAGGPLLRRFSAAGLGSRRTIALPDQLAHSIGVGPLENVDLEITGKKVKALLGATLGETEVGGLANSPVVLTSISSAQRLSGLTGRISRIFVRPAPGDSQGVHTELIRLAHAMSANVEPAGFDSTLFSLASAPARLSERLFAGISAIVAFMFAFNAMLVTVPARRRFIEDLRPEGATRTMKLQIVLLDAIVLGVLACALGLVLGDALSAILFRSSPDYLSFAFPVGNERVVTWQAVVLAVGAGAIASLAGVLWPIRDVLKTSVEQDKPPSGSNPHRRRALALIGLGLLGATTLLLALTPRMAVVASGTLLLAMLCLLPQLFNAVLSVFERYVANRPARMLAVVELRATRSQIRSLAIAATAAVALFGVVQFAGAQANLQRGLDESARDIDANAQVWITSAGPANTFATTPFTRDVRELTRVSGVGRIDVYRGDWLNWGRRRLWVLAPPSDARFPVPPSQLREGPLALASRRLRRGGWAVLSQTLAAEHNLHIGSAFTLPSPSPITLRIAGLSTNLAWPAGAIVMTSADFARAWGTSDVSGELLQPTPGVSPATLRAALERTLGPQSGLVVETREEREHRHFASSRSGLSRLTQIRLLLLIAAVLAVAGAITAMIWQRRDRVSSIKVEGYSKRVLWRWICWESALLITAGGLIGAAFGLYGQLIASHYLAAVTGFPVVYTVGFGSAIASLALLSAVTLAVLALPGYLVARTPASLATPAY